MEAFVKENTEEGIIKDTAEIEYQKLNNMRHCVLGCMLGDFDVNGNYFVDPKIIEELKNLRKYIVDSVENVDVCASQLKLDKQISFFVTYTNDSATLSLVEKINYQANFKTNSGAYSDVNEFVLDKIETSGEIDHNIVYRKWNISEFGGAVIDVFDLEEDKLEACKNLVARFKYLLKANTELLDNENGIEEIEAEYANQMLEMLKNYPKLNAAVQAELKQTLEQLKDFLKMNKPFYVKTLNEIINQIIERNLDKLSKEELAQFQTDKHNVLLNYNTKMKELLDIMSNEHIDEKTKEKIMECLRLGVGSLDDLIQIAKLLTEKRKRLDEILVQMMLQNMASANKQKLIEMLGLQQKKEEKSMLQVAAEAKKVEAKKVEAKKAEAKKVEAKKAEAKKAEAKKADAKKSDVKKTAAKKSDSKKSDAKKPDAKKDNKKSSTSTIISSMRKKKGFVHTANTAESGQRLRSSPIQLDTSVVTNDITLDTNIFRS